MISIIEHIEYLMLRHDCVVVPGLGALIAHHTAARIDPELGCIFPPRRSVTFNPALTHNDGLLASSVARRHGMGYEQAVQAVAESVAAMRQQLRQEGETGLGHLGLLSLNAEGMTVFEPYEGATLAPRYAGLSAVRAVALDSIDGEQPHRVAATPYRRAARGFVRAAAMAVLLAMLGLMVSTPIVDSRATQASLAPAIAMPEEMPDYAAELQALAERTSGLTLSLAMPDTAATAAPATAASGVRCVATDPYCLVVASLPTERTAADYIAAHPHGDEMHTLAADGRYRLYVATGKTFAEAMRPMAAPGFADRFPQAWVCRR